MDNAVALVRAYLNVNGYFTVTEYPVIEELKSGTYRTATDLDVLAVRFPGAGRAVPRSDGQAMKLDRFEPDPALGIPVDQQDLLIGEVKEGRAEINSGARDPGVLAAALVRFGCCPVSEVDPAVEGLIEYGRARLPRGRHVRLVAFGATVEEPTVGYEVVTLGEVIGFLRSYLRDHWEILHHAQFKDPALGFLMTMEKARRANIE